MDPYRLLDIPPGATLEQIRKAYRAQARKVHPDLNPGDPLAEERFKQLGEALARLTRTASRATTATEAPASEDVTAILDVPLRTAIVGGPEELRSPVNGQTIQVPVPAGVRTGQRLRMKGWGKVGRRGGPPGDLVLVVEVQPHPFFCRLERDLQLELPITLPEAVFGATVEIPTLEGSHRLQIPAGSCGGERIRLAGLGPMGEDGACGDLVVLLSLRLPRQQHTFTREIERLGGRYETAVRHGLKL